MALRVGNLQGFLNTFSVLSLCGDLYRRTTAFVLYCSFDKAPEIGPSKGKGAGVSPRYTHGRCWVSWARQVKTDAQREWGGRDDIDKEARLVW